MKSSVRGMPSEAAEAMKASQISWRSRSETLSLASAFSKYGRSASKPQDGMPQPSKSSRWPRLYTRPLMDEEPPSTLPRGVKMRRPFSAGSGSDS